MYNYSIMGLFGEKHVAEVSEDILEQYRSGVADLALFCMTLVPEGDPPIDKASILCERYDLYRDYLDAHHAECGILVQASIGHGYPLNSMFPFRQMINLKDGKSVNVVCPYDEEFRSFFRKQFQILASHRPALIMLDDDFRLLGREGMGCACPIHMAEFNKRAGTELTREELYSCLSNNGPDAKRLGQIWLDVQRDSMVGAAKEFRAGIDDIDPSIPGVYCCVAGEFEYEIAAEMAGKGHPVIVRVNNGNYSPAGARYLSDAMLRAAYQIRTANGHVDAFLAETDTCPQNRYSTGAMSLHAHFTGTILEGASGAKHWITRLSSFEPESGLAYRKTLSRNSGFYKALSEIVPKLQPFGCRIPLPTRWQYDFSGSPFVKVPNGFSGRVLERLGLPLYFSEKEGGAVFMDGGADKNFSDNELIDLLKGCLVLDGQTAMNFQTRGLGKYLGVEIREWNGKPISGELLPNGNTCASQVRSLELVPISENVREDSTVFHVPDGKSRDRLFPGTTVYMNELGGKVVVFCGDPNTQFHYLEAFSFLNSSRKQQMVALLREMGQLPLYASGDEEIYLRAGRLPDNVIFAAVFNIGLDPMETIELVSENPIQKAEYLDANGIKRSCCIVEKGHKDGMKSYTVEHAAYTLDPVILFLYQEEAI